jgi:hypothetical protein
VKYSILVLAILSAQAAATGKPEPTPTPTVPSTSSIAQAGASAAAQSKASSSAEASQQASQAIDMSLMQGGGSYKSYSLMSSGGATPLPTGLCPKGDSFYLQVLGGLLFTYATSSTRTEMECLEQVLKVYRELHKPQQVVVNYLNDLPAPPPATPAPVPPALTAVTPKPCAKGQKRNSKGVCYTPSPQSLCADGSKPSTEQVCKPKKLT